MIVVGRSVVLPYLDDNSPFYDTRKQILDMMTSNQEIYTFQNVNQLLFDVQSRVHLILSCIDLFNSGMEFRTFNESYCNDVFWTRTKQGGFQLKQGMLPSFGLRDIFANGKKYGTECATAMIIIIYKSLLASYREETFNTLFHNLRLYTWDYDQDLKLTTKEEGELIPGDLAYFKNPQVNPDTIEWQGENTVYLGNQLYYGHGVGIKTKEQIIHALNQRRKKGAFLSAYLSDLKTRINTRIMGEHSTITDINITLVPIRDDLVIATAGHTTSLL